MQLLTTVPECIRADVEHHWIEPQREGTRQRDYCEYCGVVRLADGTTTLYEDLDEA
jgi:hypothetical protein